ncbi:amidase domain-containing protein [Alkalihalobacillus sp. 1P02AB]|uniref:amidase domain-containing protein n=1 Tax=Alkalihalobacillus sp. 1P02AB TaxID=3132260 RepID=UPI0039A573F0
MLEQKLKKLIDERNRGFLQKEDCFIVPEELGLLERKRESNERRGVELVRSNVKGRILSKSKLDLQTHFLYAVHYEQLCKQRGKLYLEERVEYRKAIFEKKQLVDDRELIPSSHQEEHQTPQKELEKNWIDLELMRKRSLPFLSHHQPLPLMRQKEDIQKRLSLKKEERAPFNRIEAVRYAELWWNDYNPEYRKFTDNCTNFISQCMRAGGAPMRGYPNRSNGWWYQNNNWSFSWSVAHSFRWYLSGSTVGLRGQEKSSARELIPGDVICYDFDGDGVWQHNTIVVAKDFNGEPLVNAQTTNSRMRYWAYEDSTAWTPEIKYKFFHILDN